MFEKKRTNYYRIIGAILILVIFAVYFWNVGLGVYDLKQPITAQPSDCHGDLRFAVIGDFGDAGEPAGAVANLVHGWDVDLVITTGDNNYPDGADSTIDANIGQYYSDFISPYYGDFPSAATENRFFPALGNHDWNDPTLQAHLNYFTLPGNERYYDFRQGPVHFYVLDSDPREPDGRDVGSKQASWFHEKLNNSSAPWNLVFLHHPPFSSSLRRGGDAEMQWPFSDWGADAVFSGHDHLYERINKEGIIYFVNGLGGRWRSISPISRFLFITPGSEARYNQDYGAQLVTANDQCINFSFFSIDGTLVDSVTIP